MLGVECIALALGLVKLVRYPQRCNYALLCFIAMFTFTAAASLAGGILHGFFDSPEKQWHLLFWNMALMSVGATAVSCYNVSAALLKSFQPHLKTVLVITLSLYLLYAGYVLAGYRTFLTAIVFYLPATLLLLIAMIQHHRRRKTISTICGLTGIVLTYLAAVVQQMEWFYIEPFILNHNTVYHLIQGVALFLIYQFAAGLPHSEATE